jgi:uncharacterized protein with von Willebrand factor type A (vWA) domain
MTDEEKAAALAAANAAQAKEILTMLGEKPADSPVDEIDGMAEKRAVRKSATALELDRWNMRRGKELLKESKRMSVALGGINPESINQAADFHALAFEPEPVLVEACEDEHRHEYVKALLENPNYQAVHAETMCDDMAAEIAAVGFTEQWVVYIKEVRERKPEEGDGDGSGSGKGKGGMRDRLAAARAANNAVKQASQDVNDMKDMATGFGLGQGSGGKSDMAKLKDALKRVQKNARLKAAVERAGRFRRFAQQRQRIKTKHGADDMVGVVMAGDVARLLPHEMAKIHDEDLELDLLRRIVERQALCREWQGITTKAKGPIVLWVDESRSMDGERIADAKAIALSMAWIAQHQKRWCCLVGFASGSEIRQCTLLPGKEQANELMDWVEGFFGGGTDIPIEWTMQNWEKIGAPKGKTDLICITDGVTCVDPGVGKRFQQWKKDEHAHLTTIVVGETQIGALQEYSDKSFLARSLGLEEDCVSDIMSI